MNGHRQSGATDAGHRCPHDLHRGRDRLQVILCKDALNSNDLRLVALDDAIDRVRDGTEAKVRRQVLIGAGNPDVHERGAPRRIDVDDAEAAARQARVDAHDTHQACFTISTNIA